MCVWDGAERYVYWFCHITVTINTLLIHLVFKLDKDPCIGQNVAPINEGKVLIQNPLDAVIGFGQHPESGSGEC